MKSPFKYLLRERNKWLKNGGKNKREKREERRGKAHHSGKKEKKRRGVSRTRKAKKEPLSRVSTLFSLLALLFSFWFLVFLGLFPLFGIVFFPTDALFLFTLYLYLLYLSFEKQQARRLLSLSLKGDTNSTQIRKEQRAAVKEWRTTRRFNSSRTTSS